jgi:hypothetical protein
MGGRFVEDPPLESLEAVIPSRDMTYYQTVSHYVFGEIEYRYRANLAASDPRNTWLAIRIRGGK